MIDKRTVILEWQSVAGSAPFAGRTAEDRLTVRDASSGEVIHENYAICASPNPPGHYREEQRVALLRDVMTFLGLRPYQVVGVIEKEMVVQ